MIKLKELSEDQIRFVYDEYMMVDFPDDERKPLGMIQEALKDGRYICYGLFDEEDLTGYAFMAFIEGGQGRDYLLDYLAIRADRRDSGYGSNLLKLLKETLPDFHCMIVESENPDNAESEEECATRERRIRFYLNNGLNDTGAVAWLFGVYYRLLEIHTDDEPYSKEMAAGIYARIMRQVLPENMYGTMLRFFD